MTRARGNGYETAIGRIGDLVVAPADNIPIGTQPTTMQPAGGNGYKTALGCIRLTV